MRAIPLREIVKEYKWADQNALSTQAQQYTEITVCGGVGYYWYAHFNLSPETFHIFRPAVIVQVLNFNLR